MTTASANTVTLPQTGRPGRCSRWLGVALAVQLALAGEGLPGGDRTARAAEPPAQSGTRPAEGAPKPEPKAEVKPKPSRPRGATLWHDVEPVGQLATAALCEASGIVKSRKYEGLYWTHNDSGNPATLFAIREDGSVVARVPVSGARNSDWEDLALDEAGTLFIGDIGDNLHRRREQLHLRSARARPVRRAHQAGRADRGPGGSPTRPKPTTPRASSFTVATCTSFPRRSGSCRRYTGSNGAPVTS